MQIDPDELWPDSAALVGMQFATPDEFRRAQALLWEHLEMYRWVWEHSLTIAVRKSDEHLFQDAGLRYAALEIAEAPTTQTEEERAQLRDEMRAAMSWWLKDLGWVK
ncbi:MAG TPA: hypothetical protein VK066_17380 [Chloroflexota bacterium]|nr:hypothetical protein [Chloroflexota bacterium]